MIDVSVIQVSAQVSMRPSIRPASITWPRLPFGSTRPRLRLRLDRLPLFAGGFAIAIGMTVLVGWLLAIDGLKSLQPGALTVTANTAIAFVLFGIGLSLAGQARTSRDRRIAVLAILIMLVLAGLVGSQYVTGQNLGIDDWLVREPLGQIGPVDPNRMPPTTVVSLVLLGVGITLTTFRRLTRIVPSLVLGALVIAALDVLDSIFHASAPSLLADYPSMALPSALTVIVLCVGTVAMLPGRGGLDVLAGPTASARLARRLILASLLVPLVLAWLRIQGEARGLYGAHFGVSLMVLGTFLFLASMILRNAYAGQKTEIARQAAIEERDRFFDVSIDMLATASASGTFVRLNPAWTAILGYELDELMSRPFIEFVHPDDVAATYREVTRQIDDGKVVLNFQNRYRHRDGSYRWLEWTSSPSADGALLYAVARDITKRKLEEERLRAPAVALARRRAEARDRIEGTIETAAFGPVYQSIVDLSSGATVGYEALTRFGDGTPPDEVFATARECGLGITLEKATLRAAIAGARRLPHPGWLSLNVSPPLLADAQTLRTILGIRSRRLVLEITEHETIEAYGPLRDAMAQLGPDVRLAVDDAGAGVANFHHLVELRPDYVKIDVSLVRGVDTDMSRQAVVAGILHFATASHCQVIAEGIESEAELAMVTKLGVNLGQGYLLGRPAPAEEWWRPEGSLTTPKLRVATARPEKARSQTVAHVAGVAR